MAESRGFEGLCGLGEESTWATVVAATQLFPILSETLTENFEPIPDLALLGVAGMSPSSQGIERVAGGITGNWRYTDSHLVLKHFIGSLTAGTYSLSENVDDTGLTVAFEKTIDVWEYGGFKPTQVVISGEAGGVMQLVADGQAQALDLASATNTSVVLAGLSNADPSVLFHHMSLLLGDQDNALAAGDALSPGSISLTMNRNQVEDIVNSQQILEPLEADRRNIVLTFTLPRYQASTLVNFHRNHTAIQARLYWTDGTKTREILLPNGIVTRAPSNISGPGMMPVEAEVTFYRNAGTNTNVTTYDMNAIVEELEINET